MLVLVGHVKEFLSCRMIFSAFQVLNLNIKKQNIQLFCKQILFWVVFF